MPNRDREELVQAGAIGGTELSETGWVVGYIEAGRCKTIGNEEPKSELQGRRPHQGMPEGPRGRASLSSGTLCHLAISKDNDATVGNGLNASPVRLRPQRC